MSCEGDQKLHAFNGVTGAVIYSGGSSNELMSSTRRFSTAIVARGRIYAAGDNKVYAFTVPVPSIVLTNAAMTTDGSFSFAFTNIPGLRFTAYAATNITQPFSNWTSLGAVPEMAPGQFQFTQATAGQQRFYRVTSP
jgi:hypothetical protein